jgi:hypothetical protein
LNLVLSSREVLVWSFEPANVVVGVRHKVHFEGSRLLESLLAKGSRSVPVVKILVHSNARISQRHKDSQGY